MRSLIIVLLAVSIVHAGGPGSNPQSVAIVNEAIPVTGTFWPVTQPVSGTFYPAYQPITNSILQASTLTVTATGNAAAAVTLTLPAAVGFHYISHIEITKYAVVASTGFASPTLVTTTNLPGSTAWSFPTLQAVGSVNSIVIQPSVPLRSTASNTNTTIVCPATANVIWRVNAFYYVAP